VGRTHVKAADMSLFETTDVEAAHHALAGTYGVRRFTAPPDGLTVRMGREQIGRVELHEVTLSMRCRMDGDPLGAFYLAHVRGGAVTYEDRHYRAGDVCLVYPPELAYTLDADGMDAEFVVLGPDLLAETADTAPARRPEPIRFTGFEPATPQDAQIWVEAQEYVRTTFAADPSEAPPLMLDSAGRLLAAAALAAFPNNALREPNCADRRDAHPASLRRAMVFVDENAHRPIGSAEIAAAARLSIRGLQLSFRRHLGVTVREYVRTVRLDGAHRQLQLADPAVTTVGEVGASWGFVNHSRFTARYRAAFGVTPSHTLSR
jgi:AraC-like DNA-binding protein